MINNISLYLNKHKIIIYCVGIFLYNGIGIYVDLQKKKMLEIKADEYDRKNQLITNNVQNVSDYFDDDYYYSRFFGSVLWPLNLCVNSLKSLITLFMFWELIPRKFEMNGYVVFDKKTKHLQFTHYAEMYEQIKLRDRLSTFEWVKLLTYWDELNPYYSHFNLWDDFIKRW